VADATNYRQILIDRYGFSPENIVFLTDKAHAKNPTEVATAKRILDTFQSLLVDAAKAGDISVFIYAGHGSRMRNLGSDEPDKMDQTLVPADSEDGAPDIRDKELARLYRKAADKKVLLTIIADSCHSGGISRGAGNPPVTREAPPDPHAVNDPPDIDPRTNQPFPDPAESGYVLVISSALDNQAAEEMDIDGEQRGVFSYYFQQALRNEPPNESIDQIFGRAVALMRSAGRMQAPNIEGKGRRQASLLGTPASATAGVSAAVEDVRNGRIVLHAGVGLGLQQGCELVRNGDKKGTRIRISEPPTLANAVAEVVSGPMPNAGDLFALDRWTVPQDAATRFYVPAGGLPTQEELRAAAVSIRAAAGNCHWVSDPTKENPEIVLRFDNGSWEIELRSASEITRKSLGPSPSRAEWTAALANAAQYHLFVDFPPSREFATALRERLEAGSNAVLFVGRRAEGLYSLTGRLSPAGTGFDLEYAFVLPNASESDEGKTPLPLRSDWFPASDSDAVAKLMQRALNLARLRLWLQVSVPGGEANPFPYALALRNSQTGELKAGGTLVEGEEFDLVLTASPEKLQEATQSSMPQWVYVAAIDQKGKMQRLFPKQSANTSANRLPTDSAPTEIVLLEKIPVGEPFGTDTLIFITSEESVDPTALNIDPVQTRGQTELGAKGSVTSVLFRIQAASRGFGTDSAPTDWNVTRLTFRSMKRSQASQ
jgi:hypothetical protein